IAPCRGRPADVAPCLDQSAVQCPQVLSPERPHPNHRPRSRRRRRVHLFGDRQRRGFRRRAGPPPVHGLRAPAHPDRLRRDRDRPVIGQAHRDQAWRTCMGRERTGPRRHLLLCTARTAAGVLRPPPALMQATPAMQPVACTVERHADQILAIFNEAIATSTALYDYHPRTPEHMRAWFQAKVDGGFPLIGLESAEGQLFGFASYGTFRAWPAYKYTVEHSVYVHRDHRGQGLGERLMRLLIEEA